MSSNILTIKNLEFSYSSQKILTNIDLTVKSGETIALVGPSGFGKTTLLQLIAGDLKPISGSISKSGLWRRVFQSNGLFPWLTVEENINLGLRGAKESLNRNELIELLDLKRVLTFFPRELSGGLRQRVEIARALIGKPDGLLLDEPFSNLDYLMRHETVDYLKKLLNHYPMALVLVTHDIPEAVSLTYTTYALNGRPATILNKYENKQPQIVDKIWNDLKFKEEKLYEK